MATSSTKYGLSTALELRCDLDSGWLAARSTCLLSSLITDPFRSTGLGPSGYALAGRSLQSTSPGPRGLGPNVTRARIAIVLRRPPVPDAPRAIERPPGAPRVPDGAGVVRTFGSWRHGRR